MEDNLSLAIAYYTNGACFRMSAKSLQAGLELDGMGRPKTLRGVPVYFLASHAAELFLKAALLKRGVVESDLRRFDYRHNLTALLEELRNKGVPISSETSEIVRRLSEQHSSHQLRYTVLLDDGKKTYWPPLASIFSTLDELLLLTRISTHGV